MSKCFLLVIGFVLSACGGGGASGGGSSNSGPQPTAQTLSITPVAQQEPDWCYAASAQMIFQYYGLETLNSSSYQCGIVGLFNSYITQQYPQCALDCTLCAQVGGGSMDAIAALIDDYGIDADQYYSVSGPVLSSAEVYSPLTMQQVVNEIQNGRPILAGISPGGYPLPDASQHAVVIVGFDNSGATQNLIINDPFPYMATYQQDPYTPAGGQELQPGQYSISYEAFVQQLVWANTLYDIQLAQN
jgi:Peptidase_C39 like family